MSLSDKVNALIHPLMVKRVHRFYNKKMETIAKKRPDLFKPVDPEVTRKHLELWKGLGLPCSDKWLRLLTNISGIADCRYCPDDLYYAVVERVLNDCDGITKILDDKNMLGKFVDAENRPKTFVRFMRGEFFDDAYNWMSEADVARILATDNGPVIAKKAVDSLGGHDVAAYDFKGGHYFSSKGVVLTTDILKSSGSSYLVQERVRQCEFSAKFNPYSANTCRVISFRRPWDGTTRVVAAGMRFGVTDAAIDNMSSGGICVALGPNGELSKTAVGNWCAGAPLTKHPTSGIAFDGQVHPYFGNMCEVACRYQQKITNASLLSWDMVADEKGTIKILEVNSKSQGVDWPQFAFGSLFGEDTEKVIKWCSSHMQLDKFSHIRTWF